MTPDRDHWDEQEAVGAAGGRGLLSRLGSHFAPATADPVERLKQQAGRDGRLQRQLLIAAVLAVGGFVLLVYLPSLRHLSRLHERISLDGRALRQDQAKAAALPGIRRMADELEHQLGAFHPLSPEQDLSGFMRDISNWSQQLELGKFEFRPTNEVSSARVQTLPVIVSFNGDFLAAYTFLRRVEEIPRMLRVREMRIQRRDERSGNPGDVNVEITFNLYFRSAEAS